MLQTDEQSSPHVSLCFADDTAILDYSNLPRIVYRPGRQIGSSLARLFPGNLFVFHLFILNNY